MTIVKKNDFIEIEFTGRSNNEIFDTTDKEEAKSIGLEVDVKPLIVCVGNEMIVKGFDEALEGKETEKKYKIHLTPEKAFGKRNPSLVKIFPIKAFLDRKINPYPGLTLQLDNYLVKILSVTGGRVSVDFNNPLAGKEIDYEFTIKRIIADNTEKINALQDFFFKMRFEFEIKENKVIFKKQEIRPFIEVFKDRFKKIIGLDFEVETPNSREDTSKKPLGVVDVEELVKEENKEIKEKKQDNNQKAEKTSKTE